MEKVKFENKQGLDLKGVYYSNSKTSIAAIMMHGFGTNKQGPSNYYPELAKLLSKKFGVLRFDFQACGESEGYFREFSIRNYISDGRCAIDFMKSKGFTEFYLIGHSLGGLVSIKLSLEYDEIYKVIAIAPPLLVKLPQRETRILFKKKHTLNIWQTFKIILKFLIDKFVIQPISLLAQVNTYTTIIFSYNDSICDYENTKPKIHDSFFIQWKEIKGADHTFSRKSDKKQLFNIILGELK